MCHGTETIGEDIEVKRQLEVAMMLGVEQHRKPKSAQAR
jgi:hypothetical protein